MKTDSNEHIAYTREWSQLAKALYSGLRYVLRNAVRISPVILGIFAFTFFYLSKCSSDSNLEGIDYYNQGDYHAALNSYNKFLMLYPDDIKTLYNRARCYEALGDEASAEIDYDAVLAREPYHVNALLGLSQIYYRGEDYQTAINLSESVIMVEEDNFLAYYYTARAYHKVGYWMHALKCYNRVIELNEDYGNAYFHRSSVMISIGFKPLGCRDLRTAEALNVEGAKEALRKYCGS